MECTSLAGLEVDLKPTAPTGMCSVTISVKDTLGQIGTPTVTFNVANPKAPK